jgi:hypothetical protein
MSKTSSSWGTLQRCPAQKGGISFPDLPSNEDSQHEIGSTNGMYMPKGRSMVISRGKKHVLLAKAKK